jgi:hypothetical protein
MSALNEFRLSIINDVPRPVENSLYQMFATDYQTLVLAYHVYQVENQGIPAVLNHAVQWPCATMQFKICVAMRMDFWNSKSPSSHPLGVHGLSQNTFYQVDGSDWIQEIHTGRALSELAGLPFRHFVFAFRTRVVQIVASSFSVAVERRSLRDCGTVG